MFDKHMNTKKYFFTLRKAVVQVWLIVTNAFGLSYKGYMGTVPYGWLYQFVRATIIKYHRVGGLHNRNCFLPIL